jgi:hypothetical protein
MRWERSIVLVSILVAGVIYTLALTPQIGDAYDDGHYVMLAQAIARGEGYNQIMTPGHSPEAHFPPGWPLLLSVVWIVDPHFPQNAEGFKLLSILCTLALAAGIYGWMKWREEHAVTRLLVTLLTLFNPLILGYATSAFSEMAYACFSIFALWWIEKYARSKGSPWRGAILPSLLVASAFYIRTIGFTLLLAAVVFLLLQRDRARLLPFSILSFAWIVPWVYYTALLTPDTSGYLHQFVLRSIEQPELGTISGLDLVARMALNLRALILAGLPGVVMPSQVPLTYVNLVDSLRVGKPLPGLDLVLSVLILGSVVSPVLFRRTVTDWYVAFYLGVAILWPWEPTRFVVPLIPLLYDYLFCEVNLFGPALLGLFTSRTRPIFRSVAIGSVVLFILLNVAHQGVFAWNIRQSPAPPPVWQARYQLFDWVKRHTGKRAVLAAVNDSQVYLYTGRPVIRDLGSVDALIGWNVGYVVLMPYGGMIVHGDLSRIRFAPAYRAWPEAFETVYKDVSANIEVLQVHREVFAQ